MPSAREYLAARRRLSGLESRLNTALDALYLARTEGDAEAIPMLRFRAEALAGEVRLEQDVVNTLAREFWAEQAQLQARRAERELLADALPVSIFARLTGHLRPCVDLMTRGAARFAPPDNVVPRFPVESAPLLRADREMGRRYG